MSHDCCYQHHPDPGPENKNSVVLVDRQLNRALAVAKLGVIVGRIAFFQLDRID
jgi:hypothetical protein